MLRILFALLAAFFCYGEDIPSLKVDERIVADLRLLANGSFAPLEGFMTEKDYNSVLEKNRLDNGALFPLPIVLPVPQDVAEKALAAGQILLQDEMLNPVALCAVEDVYSPDVEKECLGSFGTLDTNHPSVKRVLSRADMKYIGGKIQAYPYLAKMDREEGVATPEEMRAFFQNNGWNSVVAFQTRNPLHRAHVALIQQCLERAGPDAALLLHPVIGPTQDEDVEPRVRMKCYQAILSYFGNRNVKLSYLPLAMRMAGPKEALLHAIIRKNYGANFFIVGRDHAGPSSRTKEGKAFYHPYAAQEIVKQYADELGLKILTSEEMVFIKESQSFVPENELKEGQTPMRVSGTEVRRRLKMGEELPSWFSFPEVVKILSDYFKSKNGFCVYLTGLSGAGKSTLAQMLKREIEERDPFQRPVTILDGDVVRNNLTAGLGFSKKDRSTNVRRIGFVASLIVNSGGIVVCANIAPYEEDRQANRDLINSKGLYFEVFVDTPIEVCEGRDVKGLYKLAREGKIKEFTGISDPYEIPAQPEVVVNGGDDPEACLNKIFTRLKQVYLPYSKLE